MFSQHTIKFPAILPKPTPEFSDKKQIFLSILNGSIKTRSEASKRLAIRSTTVSDCVNSMIADNLLTETIGHHSGRGRPSLALVANPNRLVAIVFQVVNQSIHAYCVNSQGIIIQQDKLEASANSTNNDLTKIFQTLYNKIYQNIYQHSDIAGIVYSLSGLFDKTSLLWQYSSRWPKLDNLSIRDMFNTDIPVLVSRSLDDELRMRLLTYHNESTLLLHWGYGISLAFGHNDMEILTGGSSFGEIGHCRVSSENLPCHCGQTGCLETIASLWAIEPLLLARKFKPWENEDELNTLFQENHLLDIPEIQTALTYMVSTLSNACRIFFPKHVVISGPFIKNSQLYAEFYKRFLQENRFFASQSPQLTVAENSRYLSVIGAAQPAIQLGLNKLLD